MSDNTVKVVNELGFVATIGMLTYVCCKMIGKFGVKST